MPDTRKGVEQASSNTAKTKKMKTSHERTEPAEPMVDNNNEFLKPEAVQLLGVSASCNKGTESSEAQPQEVKDDGIGIILADMNYSDIVSIGGRGHQQGVKVDMASGLSPHDEPFIAGLLNVTASPLTDSDSELEQCPVADQPDLEVSKVMGTIQMAVPTGESESSASDSESSSSTSSSSSESESEEVVKEELSQELAVLSRLEKEQRDFEVLRSALLRRDELVDLLFDLPKEEAENAILRSFVRLTVQVQPGAQDACVLAEVVSIEHSPPYLVMRRNGDPRTLKVQLKCKRGYSTRLSKISSVSNHDVTEIEFDQWKKLMNRTGIDVECYLEQKKQKTHDINAAKNFTFDDLTVAKMLKSKPETEFDAQKESRYRFLVQCAMSQMDISGIRDYEVEELEDRYKEALDKLHVQEARSTQTQANWFKHRPNLYSLKEINKKNLERQAADDKHALMFTLTNEISGKEGLNPFQRRACRPVVAWDTKLTSVEGLDSTQTTEVTQELSGGITAIAQPDPTLNGLPSDLQETEQVAQASPMQPLSRLDGVMQAHRQSKLLPKLGALMMTLFEKF